MLLFALMGFLPHPISRGTHAGFEALLRTLARESDYAVTGDCGRLAWRAVERLRAAGYEAHAIALITLEIHNGFTDGHWLVEIHDPILGWEVFDPTFDRLYRQSIAQFVHQRGDFVALTDHPAAVGYVDNLGIFRNPDPFYDRVAQAFETY